MVKKLVLGDKFIGGIESLDGEINFSDIIIMIYEENT